MPADKNSSSKSNAQSPQQTTYAAADVESARPREQDHEESGFALPGVITAPVEVGLGALGRCTAKVVNIVGSRSEAATRRARPWLEFFDLSALFKPADGIGAYIDRLRLNGSYFLFNYLIFGLVLAIISVITKPLAIIGVAFLIWVYFMFFGTETATDIIHFYGFTFDVHQKVGIMVLLFLFCFWLTTGGLQIFITFITTTVVVTIVHGCLRKPSEEALPDV